MKAIKFLALYFLFPVFFSSPLFSQIKVGADLLFEKEHAPLLSGKRVGLITNHSAINQNLKTTFELLRSKQGPYTLSAVFAPEHGFYGNGYACEDVEDEFLDMIPLYGLHGPRRRPTREMLSDIDLLIFDIQDIGSRSYTYISTLFYCMEEAAKESIPFIVLDRPNPMGGSVVDGPLLEEKWRSFLGYVNIPYCHGMTVGELAKFFNEEYKVGCQLTVIPMRGWKRGMTFAQTGLPWVPTSPQIPEPDTPFYYPSTGLIGHCSFVNIGIGYTLPFKLIGAPWIEAEKFADLLNKQNLPGVYFQAYYYRPFFGKFKLEECQGVRIIITDPSIFLPVTTQFTLLGVLKNLYPKRFHEALTLVQSSPSKKDVFNKLNGSEEVLHILAKEKYVIWKLRSLCNNAREKFMPIRQKYLTNLYN